MVQFTWFYYGEYLYLPSCDPIGRVVTMDIQEVVGALNRELFAVSGGTVRIRKTDAKSVEKWFPSVEFIDVDGKPLKMDKWKLTLKYRPHGSDDVVTLLERTVIELEYSTVDSILHSKMKSNKHPMIVVNELADGDKYMFAHMRLNPLLDLSKPIESQGAAISQIHQHTLELINWWISIK